ncbi:MAG: Cof-like hydrolase [Eubacterium sp.]|jgi:Cof subfamily protein (haloacid dehalogenase superfamily)|nr:Cof-like hydrolase [Eubacterium sp.]
MADYSKYLIITDLDGTLINSKQVISDKNLNAIKYFTEQGGRFAIATGRGIQNIRPFIKNFVLNGPCILYNGAAVYDFNHEKLLQAEFLEKDMLVDYIKYCLSTYEQMVVEIFTPEGMYIVSPEQNIDPFAQRENQPFFRADLEEVLEHHWLKLMLCDNHDTLKEAQKAFADFDLSGKFDNVFSHELYFEVLKKSVSKGSALQSLKLLNDYRDKIVVSVGDYDNDIEMIRHADLGLAVENARECVKQAADRVIVSNDNDAINDIIFNIIPTI